MADKIKKTEEIITPEAPQVAEVIVSEEIVEKPAELETAAELKKKKNTTKSLMNIRKKYIMI